MPPAASRRRRGARPTVTEKEAAMRRRGIVVVSGASAGIGRATARRFGREGWRVAVVARGEDGLAAACREIEAEGGEAMAIVADVADEVAVDAAAERVEREWGPIDVWVNNAMVTSYCEFLDMPPEDFRDRKSTRLNSSH